MPNDFKEVLDTAVNLLNFIKARPLKSRLFEVLCKEIGAPHKGLLLHTEVRRLSCGRAFLRIYQLKEQIMLFLPDEKADFKYYLVSKHWWSKLAYLADTFGYLNMLNEKMREKMNLC